MAPDDAFPFVLAAGERRSSTANTIYRDPSWRKLDKQGALRLSPADADRLGLTDGDRAKVTTKRGDGVAVVEITDTLRDGHVSLPNGFGLEGYPSGASDSVGVAPERAHLEGRPRLVRRHPLPQARAGPDRAVGSDA